MKDQELQREHSKSITWTGTIKTKLTQKYEVWQSLNKIK